MSRALARFMKNLDIHTILYKWLKKAKLRDGSHSVAFTSEGSFFYRGHILGYMKEDRVKMIWPATTKPDSFLNAEEDVLLADPKFFTTLRKGLRNAMTTINKVTVKFNRQQHTGTKQ